jgi:hypothetical protein
MSRLPLAYVHEIWNSVVCTTLFFFIEIIFVWLPFDTLLFTLPLLKICDLTCLLGSSSLLKSVGLESSS